LEIKNEWQNFIDQQIEQNIEVQNRILQESREPILRAVAQLLETFRQGGKILICGNGGSAADAQHIAAELVVRLKGSNNRPAIPAIALTVDTSILTASGNDFGFEFIYSRQIEAHGNLGDTLLALSTSGNSSNIIEAVNMAHEKGLYVIGFLGKDGGKLRQLVDLPIIIPSEVTARIQEAHIHLAHSMCDIIERELFPKS
jgi:D-sedoheptulose 7-phosphate isomerase